MARSLWLQIRNTYEAINNRWNQWVLAYDVKRQKNLLNRLGLKYIDRRGIFLWLLIFTCAVFLAVSFWLFRLPARDTDPARSLYDDFCRKMAGIGIRRSVSEGPLDFAGRAGGLRKDLREKVNLITGLYVDIRYGGKREALEALRRYVREFRPAKLRA